MYTIKILSFWTMETWSVGAIVGMYSMYPIVIIDVEYYLLLPPSADWRTCGLVGGLVGWLVDWLAGWGVCFLLFPDCGPEAADLEAGGWKLEAGDYLEVGAASVGLGA
ncbi:hypothetical protein BZA05DRAFT_405881 [Tricharina praecox]|uniref:uncharacterized protein n=1 Tax=Tricharina praecox TaxID=43433 RepID=UPI0022201F78|nr:uncharacterized protein BZA05DRAFT_405881 [Tricharina praecox]KAI5846924.1 hypothetical protein BZA05DRAFT_405881 [Tricharina praecox]